MLYTDVLSEGVIKVMAKMGISTVQSYQGAQIFEAIGLSHDVYHCYFTGTQSKLSGIRFIKLMLKIKHVNKVMIIILHQVVHFNGDNKVNIMLLIPAIYFLIAARM